MTQGVWVRDSLHSAPRRPTTKKELRKFVETTPHLVQIQRTQLPLDEPTEYDGPLIQMPPKTEATIAGPDPYHSRKWFATITMNSDRKAVIT